jgi:hypothetical protein
VADTRELPLDFAPRDWQPSDRQLTAVAAFLLGLARQAQAGENGTTAVTPSCVPTRTRRQPTPSEDHHPRARSGEQGAGAGQAVVDTEAVVEDAHAHRE